jgi:hypothetical protein
MGTQPRPRALAPSASAAENHRCHNWRQNPGGVEEGLDMGQDQKWVFTLILHGLRISHTRPCRVRAFVACETQTPGMWGFIRSTIVRFIAHNRGSPET